MKDQKDILNKYWQGESSIEEEQLVRSMASDSGDPLQHYFAYIDQEKQVKSNQTKEDIALILESQEVGAKILSMGRLIRVAAAIALIMGCFWAFNNVDTFSNNQHQMAEITDPNEAAQITMDALAFLGANYKKGEEVTAKNLQKFELTDIFKL